MENPAFMLILDFSESRIGLAVTKVEGVQYFDMDEGDTNMAGGYIQGTMEKEDRLYQLVHPSALEQLVSQHTDISVLTESD